MSPCPNIYGCGLPWWWDIIIIAFILLVGYLIHSVIDLWGYLRGGAEEDKFRWLGDNWEEGK